MNYVDLNCDLGEGMETDELVLPYMSSANIACGFHAGSPALMRKTVKLCVANGVAPGAHPGFDDKENFGRTEVVLPADELTQLVRTQVAALAEICKEEGVALQHVKPHGAMYNMAGRDMEMARSICRGIVLAAEDAGISLPYMLAPGKGCLRDAAVEMGLPCAKEVFADRAYESDGTLVSRKKPGAVISDSAQAIARALGMVQHSVVTTAAGTELHIEADSVCIHGDNPAAVAFSRSIHEAFVDKGLTVAPFSHFLQK